MIGLIIALLAILVAVTTAVYYKKLQDNAAEAAKAKALKEQAERALATARALQEEQERKQKLLEAEQEQERIRKLQEEEEERKRKDAEVSALEPPPPPPPADDDDDDSDDESDSEDDLPQEVVISEERRAEIESEQRTLEAEAEAERQQQLQELSEEQIQRRKAREQKLLQLQRELAGIPAEFVVVRDEGDSGVAWSIKEGGSRFKSLKSVTRGDGSTETGDAEGASDDPTSAVYDSPRKRRVLTLEKQGSSPAVIVETNTVLQKQLERRNSSGPDSPTWESPRTRRERERKQRRQSRLVDINAIDQNPLLVQRVAKANATKYEPV